MAKRTLQITQTRSAINSLPNQRKNLLGLGLSRVGRTRVLTDTPEVRGMVAKVAHMVRVVEMPDDADQETFDGN